MKLTPKQISQIHQKIGTWQIYFNDIKAELLDHLSCAIEHRMERGQSFEQAFSETQSKINPRRFQRQILIASHLGMAKKLYRDMLEPMILLKSAVFCATWILMNVLLFEDLAPEAAAKHIKMLMFSSFLGTALLSFSRDLLKNSLLVASANSFWLIFFIGQFAFNMDLLISLGLSAENALYTITFILSLISVSGLSQITRQYKKLKTA